MPAITKPSNHFNATLYTGTGTNAVGITGVGFQTDFNWTKSRSSASYTHQLSDSVRGFSKYLYSAATTTEGTDASNHIQSVNSDGYVINSGASFNASTVTYVSWNWKAGGAAVTNTSGSISSQVSANPTAGFSVVTASASGTSPVTIGHGLGVVPNMIIGRVRNNTASWYVYHSSMVASDYLILNSTAAKATSSNIWDTTPTSTVFTVGNPQNGWNGTTVGSYDYVFYCFAAVAGYSAFGSYTGNGATDGPFVYLGFRPRFIVYKISSGTTGNWKMHDTSRGTYNTDSPELLAESSAAEGASSGIFDLLSNGFKLRATSSNYNGSGYTYIYMAFAESPFKFANAR
jgi:hypothetical protein